MVSGRVERLGIDLQKAIALGVCLFLTGYLEDEDRYQALSRDAADALIARMARRISPMLDASAAMCQEAESSFCQEVSQLGGSRHDGHRR
jgi:hypothetical protein